MNNIKKLVEIIQELGFEPIAINIPSDLDIDKVYRIPSQIDNSPEAVAYRRVRSIANTPTNAINWAIAIKNVTEDINTIFNLIKNNKLKYAEELKEFTENCTIIVTYWNAYYLNNFNFIEDYNNSNLKEKSIDEMDADELREYIRTHNIK